MLFKEISQFILSQEAIVVGINSLEFTGLAMSEIIIGIDFGTTYSVVSYVDSEGRAVLINNAEGLLRLY